MKILSFCLFMAATSHAVTPPAVVRPAEGGQIVEGSAAAADTYTIVRVKIFTSEGSPLQSINTLVQQPKRNFLAALPAPLAAGQLVQACALVDAVESACSNPVSVLGNHAVLNCGTSAEFGSTPKEGQTRVYGSSAANCPIAVYINGDLTTVVDGQGHEAQRVTADSDGHFFAGLKRPLEAGQCVSLQTANCEGPSSSLVTSYLDFGRARVNVTAGFIMSPGGSGQNLYLAFNYDKNWIWGGPTGKGTKRPMLNTFFETRLTAIAAATTLDTFLTSRKVAELQSGLSLPYITSTWMHDNTPYAFTIGPIATAGFSTPPDNSSFYTSFAVGTRLGLTKLSRSRDIAPDLVSYFDAGMGRFSALDVKRRPWRFAFEGAFKVPSMPLILGVSANVHQNFGLGSAAAVSGSKDDLRFWIGMKFDVGSLAARLKPPN